MKRLDDETNEAIKSIMRGIRAIDESYQWLHTETLSARRIGDWHTLPDELRTAIRLADLILERKPLK